MINDQIELHLVSGIKKYFEYLFINAYRGYDHDILEKTFGDNIAITKFIIQRYKVGDYFRWHVDDKLGDKRLLAFIIYFNDNESGTEFINGKNIKPDKVTKVENTFFRFKLSFKKKIPINRAKIILISRNAPTSAIGDLVKHQVTRP